MAFRLLAAVLLLSATLSAGPAEAQPEVPPGHALFPDLPDQMLDFFLTNLYLRREQRKLVYEKETAENDGLIEVWRGGDAPRINAEIPKLILRFRLDEREKNEERGPDSFDLAIDIRDTDLVVKSSMPRDRKYAGGIRFYWEGGRAWNVFLEGVKGTGMAVFLPPLARRDPGSGMLICPRRLDRVRKNGNGPLEARLVDSKYRLTRAIFSASAGVQAFALSGGRVGLTRATILTSPNIPRSKEYIDSVYVKDPRVSLEYHPQRNEITPEEPMDGTITGGIVAQAELHRQSGHKRVSTVREQVWLREIQTSPSHELWAVGSDRFLVPMDAGVCYVFMKAREIEHKYLREPLTLPERVREAEELDQPRISAASSSLSSAEASASSGSSASAASSGK